MSTVQVDAINESTTNAGVTVDGVLIKDINKQKLEHALVDLISNSSKRIKLQRMSWANFKFSAKKSSKKLDLYREMVLSRGFVDD